MKDLGATLTTLVFTPSKTRSYQDRRPLSSELVGTGRTLVRRLLHQSGEGDGGFRYGGSREQVRRSQIPYLFCS